MVKVAEAPHGFSAPRRFEAAIADCETIGKVPTDLFGAFVRVGGEHMYPTRRPGDGPSDDGYVSMFRFRDGKVDYTGKWVKTLRWKNNVAAGQELYGWYRNPYDDDPSVTDIAHPNKRTVANTAPIYHGGKLFAMKEDGLPYQLDPKTLDTIGPYDWNGRYKSQTFTAHPKLDPVSGEMVTYGYEATGPATKDLFVYTMDRAGRITREWRCTVPYTSLMHDMALTQKHILFPTGGYVTDLDRLKEKRIHWGWDPKAPAYVGILPRDGDAKDMRWFYGARHSMMHTFNAYSEGDKVVLYAPFFDDNFLFPMFPNIDGTKVVGPERSRIRKLTFDLSSKDDRWKEEILWAPPVSDLGRVDLRYMTLRNRYGFTNFTDAERPYDEVRGGGNMRGKVSNTYIRYDFDSGKVDRFFAGDTHSLGECQFVPRKGSTAEGDGYLIGVASNLAELRSELIIADAQKLADGAIARVLLPFRSPSLHGQWVPGDAVKMF